MFMAKDRPLVEKLGVVYVCVCVFHHIAKKDLVGNRVLGHTLRSIDTLLPIVAEASSHHTHFITNMHRHTHTAVSVHQPYENKLYHINHITPLLSLSWPSLIPSFPLSSLLPSSVHPCYLSSVLLLPLIHPFNQACVCVGWSMCSSSDERMSCVTPANHKAAGGFPAPFTYISATVSWGSFWG